jgi:lipoprotein-anchoring transpeptidase ErfK/SrfK
MFRAALIFDPVSVTALLWLAWLSDNPRASLAYVARALALDPHNRRAHAALRWARQRAKAGSPERSVTSSAEARFAVWRRWPLSAFVATTIILVALVGGALAGSLESGLPALAALDFTTSATGVPPAPTAAAGVSLPPATSAGTTSPTAKPTIDQPPTPTRSHGYSEAATRASTPRATGPHTLPTAQPLPPINTLVPPPPDSRVRWIDVDLTIQTLTAYEGRTALRAALISTGRSSTPTPVGIYRIYLKLRFDDMSGPGYYLRDVPYTMYFHRGYGIHGTYWHSNFGQQMSHGCVNLPTAEAEWLFNWAEVGTPVSIHY